MAKNKETTTKQPKTIEIKMLVPYGILAGLFIGSIAFITGWFAQINYQSDVRQEAKAIVAELSTKESKN